MPLIVFSLLVCAAAFLVWAAVARIAAMIGLALPDAVRALAIGVWFSLVASYPLWLLGPYSAIGWYDAYDAVVPYELMRASGPAGAFSHAFAGGSLVEAILFLGGAPFSLYGGLLRVLGPFPGSVVFQLGALIALFMGVYLTARRLLGAGHYAAVFGALTALFVMQEPQTGTLSGLGWNFALMVWIGLLVMTPMRWPLRLLGALALALVAAATATVGFLLPTAAFYVLALLVAAGGRNWLRTIGASILPGLVFGAVVLGANWPMLRAMSAGSVDSSRFLGIRSLANLEAWAAGTPPPPPGMLDLLQTNVIPGARMFLSGIQLVRGLDQLSGLPPTILYLALLAAGFVLTWYATWRLAAAIVFLVAAGALLPLLLQTTTIPILSDYRWDTIWFSTDPMIGLGVAAVLASLAASERTRRWLPGAYVALSALLVVSMGVLAHRTLSEIERYGGWPALGRYGEPLRAAQEGTGRQRAVSFSDTKAVLGVFNGVDVLDGARQNFTPPRTAYWFLAVDRQSPPSGWHTHRNALPPAWEDVNLDMLRMANVGLVYSREPLAAPELTLLAHQDAVRLRDADGLLPSLVAGILDMVVLPALDVYRLEGAWPRVFVPAAVRRSTFGIAEASYFGALKSLAPLEALVPAGSGLDGTAGGSLALGTPAFTATGMRVETTGSGVLVYNQEFAGVWTARCEGGDALDIHLVNAIMMAVDVPSGCGTVVFDVAAGGPQR